MAFVWHVRTVGNPWLDLRDVLSDTTDVMSVDFDANRFLDRLVGPGVQPVLALFQNAGMGDDELPSYDQVRKWRMRGSMPGEWLARLLVALERTGSLPPGRPVMQALFCRTGASSKPKPVSSGPLHSVFD